MESEKFLWREEKMNFFNGEVRVSVKKRIGYYWPFSYFAFVVGIEFVPIIDPGIYHYRECGL